MSDNIYRDIPERVTLVQNLIYQIFSAITHPSVLEADDVGTSRKTLNLSRQFSNALALLFQRPLVISTIEIHITRKGSKGTLLTCSAADPTRNIRGLIESHVAGWKDHEIDNYALKIFPENHSVDIKGVHKYVVKNRIQKNITGVPPDKRQYAMIIHELGTIDSGEANPVPLMRDSMDGKLLQMLIERLYQDSVFGHLVLQWLYITLYIWTENKNIRSQSLNEIVRCPTIADIGCEEAKRDFTSDIEDILDELYLNTKDSFMLVEKTQGKTNHTNLSNLFFILRSSGRLTRRYDAKYGPTFDMRFIFPPSQRRDLAQLLGPRASLIEDCERPYQDERSILDEPFISGITAFCSIDKDDEEFQEPCGFRKDKVAVKNKSSRNKASTIIFKKILGPEKNIFLNTFPIHLNGAPLLLVATLNSELGSEGISAASWRHNFHFYTELICRKYARKVRGKIKEKYLNRIYERAKREFGFDDRHTGGVKGLGERLESINNFFKAAALSFPFPIISVVLASETHAKKKDAYSIFEMNETIFENSLYLKVNKNHFFHTNMDRDNSTFIDSVINALRRGVVDTRNAKIDALNYRGFHHKLAIILTILPGVFGGLSPTNLVLIDTINFKVEEELELITQFVSEIISKSYIESPLPHASAHVISRTQDINDLEDEANIFDFPYGYKRSPITEQGPIVLFLKPLKEQNMNRLCTKTYDFIKANPSQQFIICGQKILDHTPNLAHIPLPLEKILQTAQDQFDITPEVNTSLGRGE